MSQAAWFKLFGRHQAMFDALSNEQAGQVIKAALIYLNSGELVDMDPVVFVAFSALKADIDRSIADYQEVCEKNRQNIRKRWEAKTQDAPIHQSDSMEDKKRAAIAELLRSHPP